MSDKSAGDKTEKPTPKRLQEARRKGDVAKSRDVTSTAGLFAWLLLLLFGTGFAGERLVRLLDGTLASVGGGEPFAGAAGSLGWAAFLTFVLLTGVALVPAAVTGVLAEFLQAGPVMSTDKLKPDLSKMNPVEGLKRMFSMDNLVELAKTIAKAGLILVVVWLVLKASLGDVIGRLGPDLIPTGAGTGRADAAEVLRANGEVMRLTLAWTLGVFLMVAVLDMAWQRHSYIKKMRMSLRDIRDEVKANEGDPHIKANRRQMHQEWANQNAVGAARGANLLLVNPTHIAIALDYDPETCPVPMLAAKGEGPLAQAMRAGAEEAGVPIVRHVPVARALFEHGEVDEIIPRDMFEAIAEIILWARRAREGGLGETEMAGER